MVILVFWVFFLTLAVKTPCSSQNHPSLHSYNFTDSHSFAYYGASLMLSATEQLHCSSQRFCILPKCSFISCCWGRRVLPFKQFTFLSKAYSLTCRLPHHWLDFMWYIFFMLLSWIIYCDVNIRITKQQMINKALSMPQGSCRTHLRRKWELKGMMKIVPKVNASRMGGWDVTEHQDRNMRCFQLPIIDNGKWLLFSL